MAKFTYRRFTREQCARGGRNSHPIRVPLDPYEQRIWPLLAGTWHTSIAVTNRISRRIDQYDLIATGNARYNEILLNGALLPIRTNTELFEELRRRSVFFNTIG